MDRVVLFFCFLKPCWCLLVMSTSFNEFSSNIHFSISFSKILYLGPFCAMGILLLPTIVLKFCFGWRLFQKVRLGVFLKFQHHPLIFFGGSYHILHCFYFILMSNGLSNFLTFDIKGVESQDIKVLPLYTLSLIGDKVTTFFYFIWKKFANTEFSFEILTSLENIISGMELVLQSFDLLTLFQRFFWVARLNASTNDFRFVVVEKIFDFLV